MVFYEVDYEERATRERCTMKNVDSPFCAPKYRNIMSEDADVQRHFWAMENQTI